MTPVPLAQHVENISDGGSVFIQLDEGEVTIIGGEGEQVRVDGETFFPEQTDYEVISTQGQIQIIADYAGGRSSNTPIRLEVHVPDHIQLDVETTFASISIRDYEGDLEAASVSGDISIENVDGVILARSNRGDVTIQQSGGRISVAGNYGLLTIENVNGDTGISTIMGTITFNGLIETGDSVRLETDHGPVSVNLSPDSALALQARSNSGEVACMLPGIDSSLRTCEGEFNTGGGALTIRTVSGAVTLQLIP